MSINQNNPSGKESRLPAADTGNASNPSPHPDKVEPESHQQLLNEKAEKYLRESGNIEDLPDPQEEQQADETMEQETKNHHPK